MYISGPIRPYTPHKRPPISYSHHPPLPLFDTARCLYRATLAPEGVGCSGLCASPAPCWACWSSDASPAVVRSPWPVTPLLPALLRPRCSLEGARGPAGCRPSLFLPHSLGFFFSPFLGFFFTLHIPWYGDVLLFWRIFLFLCYFSLISFFFSTSSHHVGH